MKRTRQLAEFGSQHRHGIVLIVVLVLVVMIAMAGFGFVATMSTERKAAELHGDGLQAEAACASAELLIAQFLELPAAQRELAGGWYDNPELFRGVPVANVKPEELSSPGQFDVWRFTVVAPALDSETAVLRYGLQNESARLNLATLLEWERQEAGSAQRALMALPGMEPTTADAILDWIDDDTATRDYGAETEFYGNRPQPYTPRDSAPSLMEEFQLVRGLSRRILFGLDRDRNFFVDPHELSREVTAGGFAADEDESTQLGLSNWITLHSAERNVDRFNRPRIDLNGTDLTALRSSLAEFLPPDVVDFVLLIRQYGLSPAANVNVPATQIVSVADLIDAAVLVPQGGETTDVQSPMSSTSELTREYLPLLLDRTTTSAEETIVGRININEAPRPVLLAIPELSETTVEGILQQRRSLDSEASQTVAWLLTEGVLSLETFKTVLPWITAGGDVFRAQIVAFHDDRRLVRRQEVVFDAAYDGVRRVRWTDLSPLGPGFPRGLMSPDTDGRQLVSNQFSPSSFSN